MNEKQIGGTLMLRVKSILLHPREEWPVIDGETTTIAAIYKSHVLPLAAIGPVSAFIHAVLFGNSFFGITHRPSFLSALLTAVVSYIFTLIGVFLMALVIDFLAPRFDGTANRNNAFKLAAYSATAAWVAGIFQLVPGLGMLTILGLYGLSGDDESTGRQGCHLHRGGGCGRRDCRDDFQFPYCPAHALDQLGAGCQRRQSVR